MKKIDLKELKKKIEENPQMISGIFFHSKKVKENGLFVAISGNNYDAHDDLEKVIDQKVSYLVLEDTKKLPKNISQTICVVSNSRKALSELSSSFYKHPSKSIQSIGVTGTNGKTTTCFMIHHILKKMKKNPGLMSTLGFFFKEEKEEKSLTTSDSLSIQKKIYEWKKKDNLENLVLEVSSHGISQFRTHGICFHSLVWTHFSMDHLDYHKNMKNYLNTKKSLFQNNPNSIFIFNKDEKFFSEVKDLKCKKRMLVSQKDKKADLFFEITEKDFTQQKIKIYFKSQSYILHLKMIGDFNAYNALCALGVILSLDLSLEKAIGSLKDFRLPKGRMQRVKSIKDRYVFVDFSHTPEAFKAVLSSVKSLKPKRIMSLFGCGGDRDQSKRSLMLKEALNYSDQVYLTSDNPRNEDPRKIISDCLKGNKQDKVYIEVDRKKAIFQLMKDSHEKDLILILGKGHETKQIIKEKKIFFDDYEMAEKAYQCL